MSDSIQQEIASMSREELEQFAYIMSREQDRLHRLLELIPPCPQHGNLCMSHAEDWIKVQLNAHEPWVQSQLDKDKP